MADTTIFNYIEIVGGNKWNFDKMNPNFVKFARSYYYEFNEKVKIISSYRDINHAEEKKKIQKNGKPGAHTYGQAIDILWIKDKSALLNFLMRSFFGFTGIGVYDNWVHIDYGYEGYTNKRIWPDSNGIGSEIQKLYINKLIPWRNDKPEKIDIVGQDTNIIDLIDQISSLLDEDTDVQSFDFEHQASKNYIPILEEDGSNIVDSSQFNIDLSYGRLLFGDLYLHVPPTNINIRSHNNNFNFETIRTAGNPIIPTDKEIVDIDLELFFANTNSINNELRRIVAMFIRTPFIPIENDFISNTLAKDYDNKGNVTPVALNAITISTVPGFPNSLQASITLNEMEHRILSNNFKLLADDSDVIKQNSLLTYIGSKDRVEFKDKSLTVKSVSRAYQSLPFIKYYQALLAKDDGFNVLDPNGNVLKIKNDKNKLEPIKVYNPDTFFYKKKYLDVYRPDNNESLILEYFEADLDYLKERERNTEEYKTELNMLVQIQQMLRETKNLDNFIYDPLNKKSPLQLVVTALKDLLTFGIGIRNYLLDLRNTASGPMGEIINKVIFPYLFTYYPELESVEPGAQQPTISLKQSSGLDNSEGEKLTFIQLINKLNESYYKSQPVTTKNGNDIQSCPQLSKDLISSLSIIFEQAVTLLNSEIQKNTIPYIKNNEVILGEKGKTAITNITASYKNKLIPIHLEYWSKPAYQHIGSDNWEFTIAIRTVDNTLSNKIRKMVEKQRLTAKKIMHLRPEMIFKNAAYISLEKNSGSLLSTLGIKNAVITDYSINTVENQPGTTDILIKFTQADLTINSHETVKYSGSSPDELINGLKEIVKFSVYDEKRNLSYILKPKEINSLISDIYLIPKYYLATNNYENYLASLMIMSAHSENPNDKFFELRQKFETIDTIITDDFYNNIIKNFQNLSLQFTKQKSPGVIKFLDFFPSLFFNKQKNIIPKQQISPEFGKQINSKMQEISEKFGSIINLNEGTMEKYKSIFGDIYQFILAYLNDNRLYSLLLEFILDSTVFEDFLKKLKYKDDTINKLYTEWKKNQVDGLDANYPDLFLPAFPNSATTFTNSIFTPPDFYFKSYSFIDDTFKNDIETFINSSFDIESSLAALNGKIDYKKWQELKSLITENQKMLEDQLVGFDISKMESIFNEMNNFSKKYYDSLYTTATQETLSSDSIFAVQQMQEYFMVVIKNLLLNTVKSRDISKLIPKGEFGEKIKLNIEQLKNNLKLNNKNGKKLELEDVRNVENILGSLARNITDTIYLNKAKDSEKKEEKEAIRSYWGFKNKSQAELNRLERLYNSRSFSNLLRVGRAFPAFKIYFIEEDKNEWMYFDDFYSYSAINSIETISNKNAASDTAVIRLSNLSNRLTDIKSEDLNKEDMGLGTNKNQMPTENKDSKNRSSHEQQIESLFLKPGTNMMIKFGNSNNPMELDIIFQGVITEIQPGPITEIICQSYGNQLNTDLEPINISWNSLEKEFGDIVTYILNKIPGLNYLGKYSPVSIGKQDPMRMSGNLWFRGFRGKYNLLSFFSGIKINEELNLNDPRDDNIYLQYSLDKDFMSRLTFDWRIYEQTAWEAIQEILLYHPDYIAKVLPYNENLVPGNGDIRQTLYIGPKDGAYKYTDSFGKTGYDILNITWDKILHDYRESISRAKDIIPRLSLIAAHYSVQPVFVTVLPVDESPIVTENEQKIIEDLFDNVNNLLSIIDSKFFDDYGLRKPTFWNVNFKNFKSKITFLEEYRRTILELANLPKDYFRTRDTALSYIFNRDWKRNPQYKPVRNDHIINSFNHIIKNNITASSDEIFNKVVMTFPKSEPVFSSQEWSPSDLAKKTHTYECMVDDDIEEDKIKEYHTFQKNIDTNFYDLLTSTIKLASPNKSWIFAGNDKVHGIVNKIKNFKNIGENVFDVIKPESWQKYPTYMRVAMNILAKQMEKMYTGDVTIWGNSQIKPWDIIHIDDIVVDMKGSFEVEQVIHRFDSESGFISIIKPNLITHVQNPDSMMDEAIIDEIMRLATRKAIMSFAGNALFPLDFPTNMFIGLGPVAAGAHGTKILGSLSEKSVDLAKKMGLKLPGLTKTTAILSKYSNPIMITASLLYGAWKGLSSYSTFVVDSIGKLYGRNAIWFAPLLYKGEPYVAGLDGYKEDTYFQHIIHLMNGTLVQRIGMQKDPLDAYLLDGENVDIFTYIKTLFYGK